MIKFIGATGGGGGGVDINKDLTINKDDNRPGSSSPQGW